MERDMRKEIDKALSQIIFARKFAVAKKGPDVQLIKIMGGKPIVIMLKDVGDGLWMEPPKHEYHCTYSHFDFAEDEQRFTRRKNLLAFLVPHLKKTGLWKFIVNKDGFFKVNPHNKKLSAKKLGAIQNQYKAIMS